MTTKLALEEPKRLVYHNFKSFNNDYFEEFSSKLNLNNKGYMVFEKTVLRSKCFLNKHPQKFFRCNHKPHVFKTFEASHYEVFLPV